MNLLLSYIKDMGEGMIGVYMFLRYIFNASGWFFLFYFAGWDKR